MKHEERGRFVVLERRNLKDENELKIGEKKMKPSSQEKDLDLVVRKIKERELERRSGKLPSLEVETSTTRAILAARSPEPRNRKGPGTESSGDRSAEGGRSAGGGWGAGEGRSGGGGRGSRKQEQLLSKISRGPPLLSPATTRVKESRPKGKTIRKAHYDPREVPEDKANEILARRLQNDSKCGGRGKTRIMSKAPPRLGSDRGRARPDRIHSFDEDEDGPRYFEDEF